MAAQAGVNRLGRGLLGAILVALIFLAFCFGSSLRACIVDPPKLPELFVADAVFLFFGSIVTFAPIVILPAVAGFAIGWFTPPKALLVLASTLTLAAFGIGYLVTPPGCGIIGI